MISPSLAIVALALVTSFVGIGVRTGPSYVFATMTNLSFIFAALYSELVGSSRGRLLGSLSEGTLFLVIAGASSFGFHTTLALFQPLHTLDLWAAHVLTLHATYLTVSVIVVALTRACLPTRYDKIGTRVVRLVLSISFLIGLTMVTVYYDTIYANQTTYYLVVGAAVAITGTLSRFVIVFRENGACSCKATLIAAFEMTMLLTAVAGALYSQGGLIGRTLIGASEEYDLYHGNWHFLLASSLSVLYTRAAFAERSFLGEGDSCVCTMPIIDIIGELLLGAYAITSIVCKEAEVDITTAKVALGSIAGVMGLHAIATAYLLINKHCCSGSATRTAAPPFRAKVAPRNAKLYKTLDPVETAALKFNI